MTDILIKSRSLTLRTVTLNDTEAILGIYRGCEDFLALGPEPKASLEMVLKDLEISQQEGSCFCGIYNPGEHLVGVVDFIPMGFEGKADIAFISLIMIAAPFRNQGIGNKTVSLTEGEITKDGDVIEIRSAVQINNPAAIRFWQKNGYRIASAPELQSDSTTVFRLSKKLG
ncbi:MAG: GNAT family N-acetyltransferase [Dehalococcoidales bacterium]